MKNGDSIAITMPGGTIREGFIIARPGQAYRTSMGDMDVLDADSYRVLYYTKNGNPLRFTAKMKNITPL